MVLKGFSGIAEGDLSFVSIKKHNKKCLKYLR